MKRLFAIFSFAVIVSATTELHQLFKVPALVQHYYEHKAENNDISLADFIVLHYFSNAPRDKDYDRDMQLPFKMTDCLSSSALTVPPVISYSAERPDFFIKRSYPAVKNNSILPSHSAKIWQPPKMA
ncbi:MAG TPA: hypothetical protein PLN49_10775 [Ferruginibacter sp.]|nr:hypothetical protein [Ferruginibacter sp.]HQR01721.1 hypothetical protein [Ferruginibacter sp.]